MQTYAQEMGPILEYIKSNSHQPGGMQLYDDQPCPLREASPQPSKRIGLRSILE